MTVTKDQKGCAGVLLNILFGKDYQGFFAFTLEWLFRFCVMRKHVAQCVAKFTTFGNKKCVTVLCSGIPAMLQATGLSPTEAELHSKVGRKYIAKEPLA